MEAAFAASLDVFHTGNRTAFAVTRLGLYPFELLLVDDKGLSKETTQLIGSFVKKRGHPKEILADLKKEGSPFLVNCNTVLEELEVLFAALEKSGCINRVVFDLSLARGLDYYTGVIYEAVFKGSTQVGSIAAGGRYDNLVGMFSGKAVPAVGVSLGIERVFTIMEQIEKEQKELRATETQILVVVSGDKLGALDQAAEIVNELWKANLKAEFVLTSDKNIGKQFRLADKADIPWVLTVGKNELKDGVVKLKDMKASKEEVVLRAQMVEILTSRLSTCVCASSSSNVHPLVIAARPSEANQFAVGLTDGGVHVLEPLESEGKWGTTPPSENGWVSSMSPAPATLAAATTGPDQPHR